MTRWYLGEKILMNDAPWKNTRRLVEERYKVEEDILSG